MDINWTESEPKLDAILAKTSLSWTKTGPNLHLVLNKTGLELDKIWKQNWPKTEQKLDQNWD